MAGPGQLDRLLASLKVRVTGITDPVLHLELFNTVDEHLRATNAWRSELEVPLEFGAVEYPIVMPSGTSLVRVLGVTHRDMAVSQESQTEGGIIRQRGRLTPEVLDPVTFDSEFVPDVVASPGGVFSYSIFYPDYITITIPPSDEAATYPLKMLVAQTLHPDNLEDDPNDWPLDPWMVTRFHEDWLRGTLSKLYSQTAKPWSNPNAAMMFGKAFARSKGVARQEADKGFQRGPQPFRFPRWA